MRGVLTILGFLMLSGSQLRAVVTVKDYQTTITDVNKATVETTRTYVAGLGHGMEAANALATVRGAPLYCQPGKLVMAIENYIKIIDEAIKSMSKTVTKDKLDELPLGFVLMRGLLETFPCDK